MWTDDENIEIWTRALVRDELEELLDGKLSSATIQELKGLLFNFTYPTYRKKETTLR